MSSVRRCKSGGFLGRPVLAVLILAALATVVILALIYAGFFTF